MAFFTKTRLVVLGLIVGVFLVLTCLLIDRDIPSDILKAKYAGAASKFIDVDGLKVHYRDQGSGMPLICLHGIYASLHTWEGWVKELSGKYRLITIDLPPYGLTGPANFEYTRENYVKFLNKFVDALGLDEFYLAGNSLGGYFSWSYAAQYPNRVKKLILIDAAGYKQAVPFPVWILTTPVIGYFTRWIMPKFMVALNVRDVYGNPDIIEKGTIDRYFELMMHPGNRVGCRSLFYEVERVAATNPTDVTQVKTPTLIMWGRKDRWIPIESAQKFGKEIKNSRIIVYEDAGHVPMEEIPARTAMDADIFLSQPN